MTEKQIRNRFAKLAESYWGYKESDGSHRAIIDLYNSQKTLPRGYKVTYTDAWCATFVSAIGHQLGWGDIILPECSCNNMISLYKAAGRWEERDDYVPQIGDIIMYDWDDDNKGDNTSSVEHVGIVVAVNGTKLSVIEGNKNNAVEYRDMTVNGKFIRGYCLPNFKSKSEEAQTLEVETVTIEVPELKKKMKGNSVKALQLLLIGFGHSCGNSGADGDFGSGTETAVKEFQKKHNLEVTGVADAATWQAFF